MNFSQLSLNDIDLWADLLAVSFDRNQAQMRKLLAFLGAEQNLLAWGAWDGSRLAAQYSCLLRYLRLPWQSKPSLVGMSINMAVHPDYRGRGLVKKVSQPVYAALRERGGVAGVGFSNAAGVQVDKHSKGYGYHVVGRMVPTLAVIVRPRRVKPLHLTTTLPNLASWQPSAPQRIHFCSTLQTVNGRFAAHPFRQYHFGVCPELGVVVYKRINRWGVSLLAAYGKDLNSLLARWVRGLWQNGTRFVHLLTTPHSAVREGLRETAVCVSLPYSRHPYYLTVKPLQQNGMDKLLDFNQWDCIGGDIL